MTHNFLFFDNRQFEREREKVKPLIPVKDDFIDHWVYTMMNICFFFCLFCFLSLNKRHKMKFLQLLSFILFIFLFMVILLISIYCICRYMPQSIYTHLISPQNINLSILKYDLNVLNNKRKKKNLYVDFKSHHFFYYVQLYFHHFKCTVL